MLNIEEIPESAEQNATADLVSMTDGLTFTNLGEYLEQNSKSVSKPCSLKMC